jgi:endo-1,4-beta-xylanase
MRRTGTSQWTRREFETASLLVGMGACAPAWMRAAPGGEKAGAVVGGPDSLRAHAAVRGLRYGAAVVPALLDVEGVAAGNTSDAYTQLVQGQTNILVAENAMKWAALRPTAETFDFVQADRLMRFANLTGAAVRGHNLCWHEALPAWFKTTATKDNARKLLVDHMQTVAARYRGRIQSWDVVNEEVNPRDGRADGLRISPWLELAGPDYLEVAFQTAASADPSAKLTYNEYDIELDTPDQTEKRAQVMLLLRRLRARGIPIHAIGVQSHLKADGPQPGAGLLDFVRQAAKMGLEVYLTEMDVNTHSLDGGSEAQDAAVARVYRDYLGLMLAEPNVQVALTWGITGAHSWLNESKQPWAKRADGTRQRPLPFDDDLRPTPAFFAIRGAIDSSRPPAAPPGAVPEASPSGVYQPFPVQGSPTTQPTAAPPQTTVPAPPPFSTHPEIPAPPPQSPSPQR